MRGVENKFVEDSPVDVFCLDIQYAEDQVFHVEEGDVLGSSGDDEGC